jgi:hypothetical protein
MKFKLGLLLFVMENISETTYIPGWIYILYTPKQNVNEFQAIQHALNSYLLTYLLIYFLTYLITHLLNHSLTYSMEQGS